MLFIYVSYAGPWFSMSSISYPKIMDAQKVVKELVGNLLL